MQSHAIVWAAVLLAAPFWEAKKPAQWSEEELASMMKDSPWAREAAGNPLFLASAAPMIEAEEQVRLRRAAKTGGDAAAGPDDWREYLASNRGRHIVVAVRIGDMNVLAEAEETRRMEKECVLRSGKKRLRMAGHFPPTSSDPYLRLLFPRDLDPAAKTIKASLYLPGVSMPFREVEFALKEMTYKGKLEY